MEILGFTPNPWLLSGGVVLDLALGDPYYSAHPIRLIGRTLAWFEERLRQLGLDGYGGGILLLLLLVIVWVGGTALLLRWLPQTIKMTIELFLIYALLALRDLLRHALDVDRAATRGDLSGAREAISKLVGRDTSLMDLGACRRAAIESLSENLTDGYVSPIFWYVVGGLPGLILFKIVSTMDSMVGYKTPRYLRFGWCGARTDDLMNWVPARLTWLLIAGVALVLPRCSVRKSFIVGWKQHAIVPGPNAGWSEAATAGAIQRRLVGPIWANGLLVTEVWLGDPSDPPAGAEGDVPLAGRLITLTGITTAALAFVVLLRAY